MGSKHIQIIAIVVIATAIIAYLFARYYRNDIKVELPQATEAVEVDEETTKAVDEKTAEYFKKAEYITVEKVVSTSVAKGDESYEMKYNTYFISDVDLLKGTDNTADYTEALEEDFCEEKIKSAKFYDAFEIEYIECNGLEVLEKLLSVNGIEGALDDVTFDEETVKLTGQNLYIFNNPGTVIEQLLLDTDYDEILSSKVYYQLETTADGISYPDCFVANVEYACGDSIVTKNLYLQVTVNR